jgi:hypothetical protein
MGRQEVPPAGGPTSEEPSAIRASGSSSRLSTGDWRPVIEQSRHKRRKPSNCKGSSSTPGATRTPNLLIRRFPSRVPGCPPPPIHGSETGFRFHQCPHTTAAVHPEWLPTWLPARALQRCVSRDTGGTRAYGTVETRLEARPCHNRASWPVSRRSTPLRRRRLLKVRGSIEHLNRPSSPPLDPGRHLVQHDRAHLEAGDHRQRVLLLVRAKAPSLRRHRRRLT